MDASQAAQVWVDDLPTAMMGDLRAVLAAAYAAGFEDAQSRNPPPHTPR